MPRPATPEHMDDPNADPAQVEREFRFIRGINRLLGGTSSLLSVFEGDAHRWPRDRPMRWLDLGTGAADIPLAVDRWAAERRLAVECVALDRMPACLALARAAVGDHPRIAVVEGDAVSLDRQFPAASFDFVHAGLFLHHLEEADVLRVLRSMGRLARRAIVWNDLLRTRLTSLGIRVLTIGSPRIVRDDARLSVRKGFLPGEALDLAGRAGLVEARVRRRPLIGRFVLTARGRAAEGPGSESAPPA